MKFSSLLDGNQRGKPLDKILFQMFSLTCFLFEQEQFVSIIENKCSILVLNFVFMFRWKAYWSVLLSVLSVLIDFTWSASEKIRLLLRKRAPSGWDQEFIPWNLKKPSFFPEFVHQCYGENCDQILPKNFQNFSREVKTVESLGFRGLEFF